MPTAETFTPSRILHRQHRFSVVKRQYTLGRRTSDRRQTARPLARSVVLRGQILLAANGPGNSFTRARGCKARVGECGVQPARPDRPGSRGPTRSACRFRAFDFHGHNVARVEPGRWTWAIDADRRVESSENRRTVAHWTLQCGFDRRLGDARRQRRDRVLQALELRDQSGSRSAWMLNAWPNLMNVGPSSSHVSRTRSARLRSGATSRPSAERKRRLAARYEVRCSA